LQTLRLSSDLSGPYYLCGSCGWGTDDESARKPRGSLDAFDVPRYVRFQQHQRPDRPHAAGE
jgi:hypothetical protein